MRQPDPAGARARLVVGLIDEDLLRGVVHGAPGQVDLPPPVVAPIVINEVLTHTDLPAVDAIERNACPTVGACAGIFLEYRTLFGRQPDTRAAVFGFAQSVEQAASPVTAFLIGPLAQVLQPAIDYAEKGHPLEASVAQAIRANAARPASVGRSPDPAGTSGRASAAA